MKNQSVVIASIATEALWSRTALVPPGTCPGRTCGAPANEKSAQPLPDGKACRRPRLGAVLLAACSRTPPASAFPCAHPPLAVYTPLTPRTAIRTDASHAASGEQPERPSGAHAHIAVPARTSSARPDQSEYFSQPGDSRRDLVDVTIRWCKTSQAVSGRPYRCKARCGVGQ